MDANMIRIKNWFVWYEPATREKERDSPLSWVRVQRSAPKISPWYKDLIRQAGSPQDGAVAFAVFIKLCELAASLDRKAQSGLVLRDGRILDHKGKPADSTYIANVTEMTTEMIENAVRALTLAEWIEWIPSDTPLLTDDQVRALRKGKPLAVAQTDAKTTETVDRPQSTPTRPAQASTPPVVREEQISSRSDPEPEKTAEQTADRTPAAAADRYAEETHAAADDPTQTVAELTDLAKDKARVATQIAEVTEALTLWGIGRPTRDSLAAQWAGIQDPVPKMQHIKNSLNGKARTGMLIRELEAAAEREMAQQRKTLQDANRRILDWLKRLQKTAPEPLAAAVAQAIQRLPAASRPRAEHLGIESLEIRPAVVFHLAQAGIRMTGANHAQAC